MFHSKKYNKFSIRISGISRLKGTTLYELYLTYQQRGLNWKNGKLGGVGRIAIMEELQEKRDKDVLSAFKVSNYDWS